MGAKRKGYLLLVRVGDPLDVLDGLGDLLLEVILGQRVGRRRVRDDAGLSRRGQRCEVAARLVRVQGEARVGGGGGGVRGWGWGLGVG